jgi:hypothetical protein
MTTIGNPAGIRLSAGRDLGEHRDGTADLAVVIAQWPGGRADADVLERVAT